MKNPKALPQETHPVSIMLVEDDESYRHTLQRVIKFFLNETVKVSAEASNARDAVELARLRRPDLMLFDLQIPLDPGPSLPGRGSTKYGIAAIRVIKNSSWGSNIPIIGLSNNDTLDNADQILHAMRAGLNGYLVKSATAADGGKSITEAISKVLAGKTVFPGLERLKEDADTHKSLSFRQMQVARGMAQGLTNTEIAQELDIAVKTVGSHGEKVRGRLGVTSRRQINNEIIDAYFGETYGLEEKA